MKRKSLILTATTAVLLVWALICAAIGDIVPVGIVLKKMSCYIIAFMVAGACFSLNRKLTGTVIFVGMCLWGLYECGVGAGQLMGKIASKHDVFKLTGTFLNPGPYGGFLAMVTSSCFGVLVKKSSSRWLKITAAATMLPCAVMMAISESRAAWLGTILAAAVILSFETTYFSRIRRKALFWSVAGAVALAAVIGAYSLKPESARCRLFIWGIDCLAIAEHPVTGVGPGAEMGAYGQAQHDFFSADVRSDELVKTADSAQFVFNEFLKFGMGCGMPGLLLSIAIYALALSLMIRRRSLFCGAWIALGVFAFFSFPLFRVWIGILAAALLAESATYEDSSRKSKAVWCACALISLAAVSPMAIRQAKASSYIYTVLKRVDKLDEFAEAVDKSPDNSVMYHPEILFYYGRSLYSKAEFEKACEALLTAEKLSADPQIRCLRSECLLQTGELKEAENELVFAHMMVPVRLNPLFLLMRLYLGMGLVDKAREVREYALTIPCDESKSGTKNVLDQIKNLEF